MLTTNDNSQLKSVDTKTTIAHLYINVQFSGSFAVYLANLQQEITNHQATFNFALQTIYLAGSHLVLLTTDELVNLLSLIANLNTINVIEYSFECAYFPKITVAVFAVLKKFHVNRLVWRIKTFNQKLLNYRQPNNPQPLVNLIKQTIALGFTNFSVDLSYHLINQTPDDIINDLQLALSLQAPHISYESNNHQFSADYQRLISNYLIAQNYQHYEFFSYAQSNYYSLHTLAYLNLNNYLGFGPQAASFYHINQQSYTAKNNHANQWKKTLELLTEPEYYQLILTQGLLLKTGINLAIPSHQAAISYYQPVINNLLASKLLMIKNNFLLTTPTGWWLLNQVLSDIIKYKPNH